MARAEKSKVAMSFRTNPWHAESRLRRRFDTRFETRRFRGTCYRGAVVLQRRDQIARLVYG